MTLGIAIACLLGLAVLAYLLLPLAMEASGTFAGPSSETSELEDLYVRREGTYATLKELDFDFETGKLIEQDYRDLRARYASEAAGILERIDTLEGSGGRRRRSPRS